LWQLTKLIDPVINLFCWELYNSDVATQGIPFAGTELACATYPARYIEIVVTVLKFSYFDSTAFYYMLCHDSTLSVSTAKTGDTVSVGFR